MSHAGRCTTSLAALALLMLGTGLRPAQANDDGVLPAATERYQRTEETRPAGIPTDEELERSGATIGTIHIDVDNVFDTSLPAEDSLLFRLGNRLHIRTREPIVASQLLFSSGEPYRRRLLDESERVLRETRYLYDATIRPVAYHDGVVDIEVRSRDVWTLSPGVSFGHSGGSSTSGFELEELNLLGLGTQLSLGHKSGIDRDSTILQFRDRQLFGSWWGLAALAAQSSDGDTRSLRIERPFYALDARWAAGVQWQNEDRVDPFYDLGQVVSRVATRAQQATVYGGRSRGVQDGWVRRWQWGATYDATEFATLPGASPEAFLPADRKLVYPWVAYEFIEDEFRTARNRDQIERTEDFSLGWQGRVQLGWATPSFGADRSALLLDARLGKGFELDDRQTLLFESRLGGRLEDGAIANGRFGLAASYYRRQTPRRLFYASLQADVTRALDADQQLLLGGDNGLRGYPLRYQGGTGRWLFTAEQRLYTNWYPFRLFHVGGAVFYDMGSTWGPNPLGTPSQGLLRDIGFGLRLGSSRSAHGNVLHLDVAFPLDGDNSIRNVQFLVETKRKF